jgi:hypothetical protein
VPSDRVRAVVIAAARKALDEESISEDETRFVEVGDAGGD